MLERIRKKTRNRASFALLLLLTILVVVNSSCTNNAVTTNSPEQVVEKYIQAYLGGDLDGVFETMSPQEAKELEEAYGEDYKDEVSQQLNLSSKGQMQAYDMTFQEDKSTKGDKAIVFVTDGKMKYMGSDGNWVYPSYGFRYKNSYFETINIDGLWYVENLFEVGAMRIIFSEELTNDRLDEISAFLATIPGVDRNSIDYMNRHQIYESYIETHPDMKEETTDEGFPLGGKIDFQVTDLREVLPAKTAILENMPFREAIEKLNTFSVSANQ
jgi:hypothetical protein